MSIIEVAIQHAVGIVVTVAIICWVISSSFKRAAKAKAAKAGR